MLVGDNCTEIIADENIVGLQWHLNLCSLAAHALLDPAPDCLRHCYSGCTL